MVESLDPIDKKKDTLQKNVNTDKEIEKQLDSIAEMNERIPKNTGRDSVKSSTSSRSSTRRNQKGFGDTVSPLKKGLEIEIPKDE
jgi:hypothetical protein